MRGKVKQVVVKISSFNNLVAPCSYLTRLKGRQTIDPQEIALREY